MELWHLYVRDFCVLESADLPLAAEPGLVLVVGENQDTDGASSNGSGKSTLFKALTWCLFGETIDGDKHDEVIRKGTRQTEVQVVLREESAESGEVEWRVVRRRTLGSSPELILVDPADVPSTGTRDEVQASILRLIGMDWRTFKTTVLFGQGDRDRFAAPTTPDRERKEIVHRALGTEELQAAEVVAKAEVARLKGEVLTKEREVERLRARIEEHDLATIEADLADWDHGRMLRMDEAEKRRTEWTAEAGRLRTKADETERTTIMEERRRIDIAIKDCDGWTARLGVIARELATLRRTEAEQIRVKAERAARHEEAKRHNDDLAGDTCPTCTTPLTAGAAAVHKSAIASEVVETEKALTLATTFLAETREAIRILGVEDARGRAALREAPRHRKRMEIEDAKLAALDAREKDADDADAQTALALEDIARIAAEVNPYAARLETARARLADLEDDVDSAEVDLAALRADLGRHQWWQKGFGPKGLPSMLFDSAMPVLTASANAYLEILADGDISGEFSSISTTAKGETRDTMDLRWVIEGQADTRPSGGQQKKIEVATDLALMDLASMRAHARLGGLLLMDEVLDGLDPEGRERVLQLLHHLRSQRPTIFVVTHEPGLAEDFERVVKVVKRDKRAVAELMT